MWCKLRFKVIFVRDMETLDYIQAEPKIGEGIFLTTDVSQILGLPSSKVRRWMKEYWPEYTFGDTGNQAVNFKTLIEFYTFFHLRDKGLSVSKIEKYHQIIADELDTSYPFARSIRTDGKHVWYERLGNLIKADQKKQFDIKPILEPFLHKIDFGDGEIAQRFFPLKNTKDIVVDPQRQFGQPIVNGTSIKAETLYNLYKGGEKTKHIAELYDLNVSQVKHAIEYFRNVA
jgi:uncharacterized protein (DUF433 family)